MNKVLATAMMISATGHVNQFDRGFLFLLAKHLPGTHPGGWSPSKNIFEI